MKKIILILIGIGMLLAILIGTVNIPVTNPIIKTYPYIRNNILYRENTTLPLSYITGIQMDSRSVNYMVFTWQEGKYKGGIFSLTLVEFEKIRPQIERYYAQKNS